jgi:hypothetical protein
MAVASSVDILDVRCQQPAIGQPTDFRQEINSPVVRYLPLFNVDEK